jgi:hypothetical protein
MLNSKQLAKEAAEAQAAAEALAPEVEVTQARLAAATEALETAESQYNLALEAEAGGTPADVEGLESRRNIASRAWQGLGNLAGKLATTMAGHRDRAEALRKQALGARRDERARLAMARLPQLALDIVKAEQQRAELGHEFTIERAVLMHRGPWNQAADKVIAAAMKTLKPPTRVKPPGNTGEIVAFELELNSHPDTKGV